MGVDAGFKYPKVFECPVCKKEVEGMIAAELRAAVERKHMSGDKYPGPVIPVTFADAKLIPKLINIPVARKAVHFYMDICPECGVMYCAIAREFQAGLTNQPLPPPQPGTDIPFVGRG